MNVLITGGAGFIGSNFVRYWHKAHAEDEIVILDALTYAGHLESLRDIIKDPNITFIKGDITDSKLVNKLMDGIDLVVHFAAESHVDRSVIDPLTFVKTNVLGTGVLLQASREHKVKHFHHVSTDEVFGELKLDDPKFNEQTPLNPRTPYSASKTSSDLLVHSYFETYGMPVTISNCSNNYGPFHDPEKVIPRFITNLLEGKKVPLMGKGEEIRDWLYVDDHCRAIDTIIQKGEKGERYCIGGDAEMTNYEVTRQILQLMDFDESMIEYVGHRLGHDFRYAIDASKLKKLGWQPQMTFDAGLKETVEWFKNNEWWWKPLKEGRPIVDRVAQKSYTP